MESIHGLTKGTELEPMIKAIAQAEANGTMMYYALARLAREQGLDEVAEKFIEAANQEAVHAGFYATLNGKYPKNFWGMVATLAKAETAGEAQVKAMADKVRAAGFTAAADEMEIFAKQEGHHGVILTEIIEKYKPKGITIKAVKLYENGFMTQPFADRRRSILHLRARSHQGQFDRDRRERRAVLHHSRRCYLYRRGTV